MSEIVSAVVPATRSRPLSHWWRQVRAILRLELRKGFRRPFGLLLLALSPAFIAFMRTIVPGAVPDPTSEAGATEFYAGIYQVFILRIVIFLACVSIFGNLIRRETLDRSLHYYLLSPVRRELLVVAKYLTGLLVSFVLFGSTTVVTFLLAYAPHESSAVRHFFFGGPGLGHLATYVLVTFLACVGYGAVFLFFGFFFKSPALPALGVLGWEWLHFLLPPLLKKLSVIHYLQSLCPVPIPEGALAVLADPSSPWIAVPGLLLLAAFLISISAWKIRGMEISYDES